METNGKPPILGLVGEALRDVFGHLGGLARIAWPYYALAAALILVGGMALGGSTAGPGGWLLSAFGAGTASLVTSIATLACIVRWQRHVVLAEPLRGIAPLDGRVLRYALWSFLLCLIGFAPIAAAGVLGFALGLIRHEEGATPPFAIGLPGIALLALGVVVGLFLFVRLMLILPAVSVDDRDTRWRASWQATRAGALRLMGVMILLALGLGLLGAVTGLVTSALTTAMSPEAGERIELLIGALLDLVSAVIGASLLAHVYRRLRAAPIATA